MLRIPILLFAIFLLYGPSVHIVGQFRYAEMVILVLLFINWNRAQKYIGNWEWLFFKLFLLAAFSQVVSDIVNDADLAGTLKRSFTYIILAFLILGVRFVSRGDLGRLRWIWLGYCLSYVVVLFIGQSSSAHYNVMPWRLGLGAAVTMIICLVTLWKPRLYPAIGLSLIALSAVHLTFGARSLAALVFLSGILSIAGAMKGDHVLREFRLGRIVAVTVIGIAGVIGIYEGARIATELNMFPSQVQVKMQQQFSNPYGILAAGRPDTVAAIYGITKKPLLGFGSTNVDPDVYAYYAKLDAANFIATGYYEDIFNTKLNAEWRLGTPSHSHLFGAWVDAGVAAALGWIAYIAMAIYLLQRIMRFHHPIVPLLITVSLFVVWDTLFSPGPIRMDVAIRLSILIYGVEFIRSLEPRGLRPRRRSHRIVPAAR